MGIKISLEIVKMTSHFRLTAWTDPATVRPTKSPKLKRKKQVTGVKYVVVRGLSSVTLFIEAVTAGKTVRVTQNVHHTLNSIHFICLTIVHEDTVGALNDCDN